MAGDVVKTVALGPTVANVAALGLLVLVRTVLSWTLMAEMELHLVVSMGGIIPVFGYTAYGTSKFAVMGFAQCLRYELKPRGINVACFCPGEVETPG